MKIKPIYLLFLFIFFVNIAMRWQYRQQKMPNFQVTTYDALGYYLYLPSVFIYKDVQKLNWFNDIEKKYQMTGGDAYQIINLPNQKVTFKYLGGVAILELPFFLIAHVSTSALGYAADGFSLPYQMAIVVAAFFYGFVGLWLLYKTLLIYFDEKTAAFTIALLGLATNWTQYLAIDSGMSHIYIFFLYSVIIYLSDRWHNKPTFNTSVWTGLVIGLATISRPTEAIMFFIPLLWQTHSAESARKKWALVGRHKTYLLAAIGGGLIGILPQLLYWKHTTGHFIFDVGSKWYFLNPYFRVLFGFEKGWFVYTPVTILMFFGLFRIKNFPFGRSVLVFCLLNLWIIMAWSDWRYGASYSCRALVQSYPVFAFALGAIISQMQQNKWQKTFYFLFAFLICLNLFQLYQYNSGIIKYDENSFEYYKSIFMNPFAPSFYR
jgi:hypothetical protein